MRTIINHTQIPIQETLAILDEQPIQNKIYTIRELQVMLDRDLAEIYGVETKRINEAVKNNEDKFQEDFFFELTDEEFAVLRSKLSTANFSKTRANFGETKVKTK